MKLLVKLVPHLVSGLVVLLLLSTPTASQSEEELAAANCEYCGSVCNCTKVSVYGFSVSNVASQSASLNWDRTTVDSFTGYAIIYGIEGDKKDVEFINSPATTTTVLRNLQPFANYTAYIRPTCPDSFALCTIQPLRFTTSGERPSGVPQDVMVMEYGNGIRVTWRPPPRDEQNGPLTGYMIYITTLSNGTRTSYMVEGGSATDYVLSTISPGQYALRMSAVNMYGEGSATTSAIDFTISQQFSESDDFDFWESEYRYLLIPVVIILAVLIVGILLFIKWKYYPSTVLYCKDIVEKQTHVYADQRSPTDVATEFSFTSPFPHTQHTQHTQLQTQSISSNSEETSHSAAPASQRVLNVSPPNHRTPDHHMPHREIVSPNDSDSVFGPYAEIGLQKNCSPGVKYPPIPNMSRHPSLWPHKRNRMGIGRANSTAGDTTTTLPAHAVDMSTQPSPYEVPHSVTDAAESLTLSDPSINQDDFSPPGRMYLPPHHNQQSAAAALSSSRSNMPAYNPRAQNSVHTAAATQAPPMMYPPSRQHHEMQEMPAQGGSPRVLGQKHITQSQTSMGSIPPVPYHPPPPLTKSSLDLVARLEKGHESIEDLMETIEQVEQEERKAERATSNKKPVPFYSEPFDTAKKPPEDMDPSCLQSGAKNSSSLPRFTRMNSVPNTLGEDLGKKHHKISVPSNIMMAGATPPVHSRSNINRFPSTRSEQPLPYLKERHNQNYQEHFTNLGESVPYVPPSSISDCR